MKSKAIYVIGSLCLVAAFVIGIISFSMVNFDFKAYGYEIIEETKTFEAININELKVDMVYGDIIVNIVEQEEISITHKSIEENVYIITIEDNKIIVTQNISEENGFVYHIDFKRTMTYINNDIVINLPNKEYEKMEIKNIAGTFKLNNVMVNELDLSIVTGNIEVANAEIKKADLNVTTGNLIVSNSNIEELTSKTITGNINLTNVISNIINAKSTTGNLHFTSLESSDITFNAVTGNIKGSIKGIKEEYNISINKTTGNSNIGNQKGTTASSISASIVTGNIKIEFIIE